jgi:1-acyl-sn-glycerol-3-phosphate acyltransferase
VTLERLEHDGGLPTSADQRADRQRFVMRNLAILKALVRLKYFSWEIEGAHHLPRQGPVVYAMNHAGWLALDTIMVGCSVAASVGVTRTPYFAAIDSALTAPVVGPYFRRLGALPVSLFRHPNRLPPEFESYGICPEGVLGNCKPFWRAYRMREWNRGFVRLAMALEAPIVPVAVFGGEECLPVAWTVRVLEPLIGSIVGLPLAPVPLPARWKIVFHEPVHVTSPNGPARRDPGHCNAIARRLQGIVQETLDRETGRRPLARFSSLVAGVSDWARETSDSRGCAAANHGRPSTPRDGGGTADEACRPRMDRGV